MALNQIDPILQIRKDPSSELQELILEIDNTIIGEGKYHIQNESGVDGAELKIKAVYVNGIREHRSDFYTVANEEIVFEEPTKDLKEGMKIMIEYYY